MDIVQQALMSVPYSYHNPASIMRLAQLLGVAQRSQEVRGTESLKVSRWSLHSCSALVYILAAVRAAWPYAIRPALSVATTIRQLKYSSSKTLLLVQQTMIALLNGQPLCAAGTAAACQGSCQC